MVNQYWAHRPDGEKYAVQVENGVVISACGPLYYKEVTQANIDSWNFENDAELASDISEHQDEYGLVEGVLPGDEA